MAVPHSNMDSMDDMFAGDGGFDYGASLDFLNRWTSDQQQLTLPNTASPAPVAWNAQPALGQGHIAYSQPQLTLPVLASAAPATWNIQSAFGQVQMYSQPQLTLPAIAGPAPVTWNVQPALGQGHVTSSQLQQHTLPAFAGLAPVVWNFYPALGQGHVAYNQPGPTTVFTLFNNLPLEIQGMILKHAFKDPNLFRLGYNGRFHVDTRALGLFWLNKVSADIYRGLVYRHNVFTCPFSHSIPDLLHYSAEVTTNVHHITIPVNILAQRRVVELRRLPNLKTVRIEGFDARNHREFHVPARTLNTIQRLQHIKTAVRSVLRKPAARGSYSHPRFDATKREVKQLINVKQVEVSCAAKYGVHGASRAQLFTFETVFKIKLVESAEGYELEVLSDKMV